MGEIKIKSKKTGSRQNWKDRRIRKGTQGNTAWHSQIAMGTHTNSNISISCLIADCRVIFQSLFVHIHTHNPCIYPHICSNFLPSSGTFKLYRDWRDSTTPQWCIRFLGDSPWVSGKGAKAAKVLWLDSFGCPNILSASSNREPMIGTNGQATIEVSVVMLRFSGRLDPKYGNSKKNEKSSWTCI